MYAVPTIILHNIFLLFILIGTYLCKYKLQYNMHTNILCKDKLYQRDQTKANLQNKARLTFLRLQINIQI